MKFRLYRRCCIFPTSACRAKASANHGKPQRKPHAAKEIDCKVTHFYSKKEMFPNFIYINMVFQCCNTQKGRNVLYFNGKKT